MAATTAAPSRATADSQIAPNPKAYLESGVIKPHDLVNVKKVIVIGSGGLSIGQAGEFDYSGWLFVTVVRPPGFIFNEWLPDAKAMRRIKLVRKIGSNVMWLIP